MVSRMEIRKDTAQVVLESTIAHVGRIASILSGAVREVTTEFGEWATDIFEIREAADHANRVHVQDEDGPRSTTDSAPDEGPRSS